MHFSTNGETGSSFKEKNNNLEVYFTSSTKINPDASMIETTVNKMEKSKEKKYEGTFGFKIFMMSITSLRMKQNTKHAK